jgi:putative salt-induced outer membrane protein
MKTIARLTLTTGFVALIGSGAMAQGALSGFDSVDDRIEDITTDATDDIALEGRDVIGPMGVPQGWTGSLAATGSLTSGNTDTSEFKLAARMNYGSGLWTQSFGAAAEFAEANDERTRETYFATYEANYALSNTYYVYGLARAEYDRFGTNEIDGFAGAGVGFNVPGLGPQAEWRVQAGPGVRFVREADEFEVTETALLVSSRLTYTLSDMITLTNDTDILGSELNTVANNELGVNFRMTDAVSTRVSYRTQYNSDPLPGFAETDNTLGFAVVVGF